MWISFVYLCSREVVNADVIGRNLLTVLTEPSDGYFKDTIADAFCL